MALVRNPRTLAEIKKALQIQSGADPIHDQAIPTIECNPMLLRPQQIVKSTDATANSNSTLYTTPASGEDFYLCSASLDVSKDATCDMATGGLGQISVIVDGATLNVAKLSGITTTAQNKTIVQTFSPPIKLDPGTAITGARGGAFTVGVCARSYCITGFLLPTQ